MSGFTSQAKKALSMATDLAMDYDNRYVGSEHLLLALCKVPSVVKDVLSTTFNCEDLENLLTEFSDETVPMMNTTPVLSMSEKLNNILKTADEMAEEENRNIETQDLMIGILKEFDCMALRMLNSLNVNLIELYQKLLASCGYSRNEIKHEIDSIKRNGRKKSMLDTYTRDLTDLASHGKLDPVIGREKEITRIIEILGRRTKNNPCLIGEPGIGKTAVVEGLAQLIANKAVPEAVQNIRLLTLDLSGMIAGSKYRGEFEERIKRLMEEVKAAGNVVLFLDEIHTLIGAGNAEGSMDAANILKPALSRGEIKIIGATTRDEYRKHIEKDAALERRFQPISVEEPDVETTVEILKGLKTHFEKFHNVKITDDAILSAVTLSSKYVTDRYLPDKAIDCLDETCSRIKLSDYKIGPETAGIQARMDELVAEKEKCLKRSDAEGMKAAMEEEKELKIKLYQYNGVLRTRRPKVSSEDIANVISGWTGIPLSKLSQTENEQLLKLEKNLHKRVIGQNEAIEAVAKAIRRGRVGIKDPNRPIGSFLFLGPTGVGKTELCKALAENMFGKESSIIRVDMSEYMEKHSVSKMIGSPPGYVGHEEGGQLSEQVRQKPYSIVLFDEIEKAHPDVFNVLLQVLDEGTITDSQGRHVSFKNTIIIMTSNAGAQAIVNPKKLGFSKDNDAKADYEKMKSGVMEEVKRIFKPEFINRIDDIIVFHELTKDEIANIVKLMLNKLSDRVKYSQGISIKFSSSVIDFIAKKGYDPKYGARPLKRAIQDVIEDEIADEVLRGKIKSGMEVSATMEEDKLLLKPNKKKK